MKFTLDITKSLEANASHYYEKAKRLKKKIEGTDKAIAEAQRQLAELQKTHETKAEKKESLVQKEWYEKFRWFFTSDGFLVIGGRDATSNEIVIKKHTEKDDKVFHTDMVGSPFFVLKAQGRQPTPEAIRQAADATVTFSKAFKLGRQSDKVFMADPEQLTKTAKSGEYVPKGGFVTLGKLAYIENKVNLALGNKEGHIMAGPVEAIKEQCPAYVQVVQGSDKPSKTAKTIHHRIGGSLDDVSRALPSGTFKIIDNKV